MISSQIHKTEALFIMSLCPFANTTPCSQLASDFTSVEIYDTNGKRPIDYLKLSLHPGGPRRREGLSGLGITKYLDPDSCKYMHLPSGASLLLYLHINKTVSLYFRSSLWCCNYDIHPQLIQLLVLRMAEGLLWCQADKKQPNCLIQRKHLKIPKNCPAGRIFDISAVAKRISKQFHDGIFDIS